MAIEKCHLSAQLLHSDFGVDLGGGYVRVSEYTADALDGYAGIKGCDGKGVPCTVECDVLGDATGLHQPWHLCGECAVVDRTKYSIGIATVTVDDVEGYRPQPDDEGCVGFLSVCLYPQFPVDLSDLLWTEVADIDERHAGEG